MAALYFAAGIVTPRRGLGQCLMMKQGPAGLDSVVKLHLKQFCLGQSVPVGLDHSCVIYGSVSPSCMSLVVCHVLCTSCVDILRYCVIEHVLLTLCQEETIL